MEAKTPRELPQEVSALPTKSARIRALKELEWSTGDIARAVGVTYQFAWNVLSTPLKRVIKKERAAERAANLENYERMMAEREQLLAKEGKT